MGFCDIEGSMGAKESRANSVDVQDKKVRGGVGNGAWVLTAFLTDSAYTPAFVMGRSRVNGRVK